MAEFGDPQRLGLYVPDSDRVLLARRVLTTPQLYGVLAHEIAHRAGPDGSASQAAPALLFLTSANNR